MRNMMAALLLAHGVPMINMGDEYGHRWVGGWVGSEVQCFRGARALGRHAGWTALAGGTPAGALCRTALPGRCSPPPPTLCSPLAPSSPSSKGGNNNTYCHDSPLNYLDWQKATADDDGLLRFTRHMIGLR